MQTFATVRELRGSFATTFAKIPQNTWGFLGVVQIFSDILTRLAKNCRQKHIIGPRLM
jgi:hypothetical protein